MFIRHWFIAMVLSVMALGVTFTPWAQALEDLSFGMLSHLMPEKEIVAQTVVVSVDGLLSESSRDKRVSYSELARLIGALQKGKPKAIGIQLALDHAEGTYAVEEYRQLAGSIKDRKTRSRFDSFFAGLSSEDRLARRIAANANVVLAGYAHRVSDHGETAVGLEEIAMAVEHGEAGSFYRQILSSLMQPFSKQTSSYHLPLTSFSDSAASVGLITESDQKPFDVSPAQPLIIQHADSYLPGFLLSLFAQVHQTPSLAVSGVPLRGVLSGDVMLATDPMGRFVPWPRLRINGQLLPDQLPVESLAEKGMADKLPNKIILLGNTGMTSGEEAAVFSSMNNEVLRNAYLLEAMLAGESIQVPYWSLGLQRAFIILFGVYLILMPRALRGKMAMVLAIGCGVVMVVTELLLLLTSSVWVSLMVPALFLIVAQAVLNLQHCMESRYGDLVRQLSHAYRELATSYQTHGQLDQAYQALKKCNIDNEIKQDVYQLGLEFERRRQFNKAIQAYNYLHQYDSTFQDVSERRQRLSPSSSKQASGNPSHKAETVVIDDAVIEYPIIGRYQIERQLGRGAMGKVYLGVDPKIGRTVAIKTLSLIDEFEGAQVEEARQRFYKEAEAAGKLDHPNIVTIYDAGEEHDLAYIAMDHIAGEALDAYVASDTLLPVEEVFEVGAMIAEALDYAHSKGVIHRDIKPANVIYSRDTSTLKVTDFGIARATNNSKTSTGVILGSPFYMSPEQISGKKVDGRSDLYSLGITLYQLFTGRLPFYSDTIATLAYQITSDKPKGMRQVRADLPHCLSRIMNRALEKDPGRRFQDGKAMAEALRRCGKK